MKKLFAIVALVMSATAWAATAIPPLNGQWVVDTTGSLSKTQINDLSIKASKIAESTGSVAVALLTNSTNGENIDDFAMRVAETWHPGKAGVDRAVVLVIAKADRKMAIKTTRNTGILYTDARTKATLNLLKEPLRNGSYAGAINTFYDDSAKYLVPDKLSTPVVAPAVAQSESSNFWYWVFGGGLFAICIGIAGMWWRSIVKERERQERLELEREAAEAREAERRARRQEELRRSHEESLKRAAPFVNAAAATTLASEASRVFRDKPKVQPKPATTPSVTPARKRYDDTPAVIPVPVPTSSYSSSSSRDDDDSWSRSSSSYSASSSWSSSDSSSSSSSFDGGGSSSDW